MSRELRQGRAAALEMDRRLRNNARFAPSVAGAPELDIVAWRMRAENAEKSTQRAQKLFDACAARDLHLALVQLPQSWFESQGGNGLVTCLRSVLMKPEHEAWLGRIWERLVAACNDVVNN